MKFFTLKTILLSFLLLAGITNANAQAKVLNISASETHLPADVDDQYDRIIMNRDIPTGRWTALVMPADLDGYYFGIDTERYIIRSINREPGGELVIKTATMHELDDFMAGVPYLIKPKNGATELKFITAGIQTSVNKEAGELYCMDATGWVSEPTAIDNMQTEGMTEGKAYDLSGREINVKDMLSKGGIFIYNGKKHTISK